MGAETMAKRISKPRTPTPAAIVEAAAGLATSTIALAAADATKTLAVAANVALQTLAVAATKAVSDFPRIQDDIRELRQAHVGDVALMTATVTDLIERHTRAEEGKLADIAEAVGKIEKHINTQNGRIGIAETHITRQNLVIFGIVGPTTLMAFGYFITRWM